MTRGFKYCLIAGWMFFMAGGMLSCSKKDKLPEGVMERDAMVKTLMEILVSEEKVNRMQVPGDSSKKVFTIFREKLFAKAGVEDSAFHRSMNYYIDHPQALEQIYTALVDSLNLKEQRASVRPDAAVAK